MKNNTIYNSGTILVDRQGRSHKAYSVLLKDADKIRRLLPKIDSAIIINNILNTDSEGNPDMTAYEALLEFTRLVLGEHYTNQQIEEFLDAEMARKIIRIGLNLPIVE